MSKIRVHNQQGQQLPKNWQAMAKSRAANAEAAYMTALQNAWRQSNQEASGSLAREARLQQLNWNDLFGQK